MISYNLIILSLLRFLCPSIIKIKQKKEKIISAHLRKQDIKKLAKKALKWDKK